MTLQALWKVLLEVLKDKHYLAEEDLPECAGGIFQDPADFSLHLDKVQKSLTKYDEDNKNNGTSNMWRSYMEMAQNLLAFIRADREANWELHLDAFEKVLPDFAANDEKNYARWGTVYTGNVLD